MFLILVIGGDKMHVENVLYFPYHKDIENSQVDFSVINFGPSEVHATSGAT